MLRGFSPTSVTTEGVRIHARVAGSGRPVLLLHGYPQTHVMWHAVAPALAERFTVVCADLRGYGASDKPPGDAEHVAYSKRVMAGDMVALMRELGFESFQLVGHDRGGRVAHRLALDHAERVERLAVLDIVPTHDVFAGVDADVAFGTYHWFFLSQPFDLPERLIGADPEFFLRWHLRAWSGGEDGFFASSALAAYVEAFREPAMIHATCEDYRAGATIDLEHDRARLDRRITCPLLVVWGRRTKPGDLTEVWRRRASDVRGVGLPGGHFIAEELPEETAAALLEFLEH